jgi:uncharacterized membrane protein
MWIRKKGEMEYKKLIFVVLVILLVAGGTGVPALVDVSRAQSIVQDNPEDLPETASLYLPASGAQGLDHVARAHSPAVQESASAVPGWEQVNSNGFGVQQAGEVSALEAFNGYLYAGTHNPIDPEPLYDGAGIFRSPDGVTWTSVILPGFGNSHDIAPPAILDFIVFNNRLYASTGRGNASQIWRTLNGVIWAPMDVTGFSDPDNVDITALAEYGGKLYAGVTNQVSGAQIWSRFTGDNNSWTQVAPAVPGTAAAGVTALAVFDGGLYAAVEYESDSPAQIWRSYGGAWTTIMSDGFGDSNTTSTGGMAVFAGYLYVGAGNTEKGAQLWRTNNGTTWQPAISPGFGDPKNLKVEMVYVFQNQLYVSVKNSLTGIELWRSTDGALWERANQDGFSDSNNSGSNWSNASADFLDHLYVGTSNVVAGGELWRMQQPYGVNMSPDQANHGSAGQTVAYSLWITNTGHMADDFDLTATGQTWTTNLSTSLVSLAPSASAVFTASVAIPPGAADQETDSVNITATSQGDSSKTASAALTTTSVSAPVHGVALSDDDSLSGPAGGQVIYTLTISNTGNVVDIFDLLPTGNGWTTTLSSQVVTLAASGSQEVTITVLIPPGAADQETDTVNITATSQGESIKTASAALTTTSVSAPVYGVALSGDDSMSGLAGEQVIYTLTISNTGNVVDTIDLLPTGNSWTTMLSTQIVTLAAGDSQPVTITVLIPPAAATSASDQVSIQASSRHDSSKNDTVVLTTFSIDQFARIYLPIVMLNTP